MCAIASEPQMSDEQARREAFFIAGMELFRTMLKNGLITDEEYSAAEKFLYEKYSPLLFLTV